MLSVAKFTEEAGRRLRSCSRCHNKYSRRLFPCSDASGNLCTSGKDFVLLDPFRNGLDRSDLTAVEKDAILLALLSSAVFATGISFSSFAVGQ